MKKVLISNYWLMAIAWCMFLNGYSAISMILSLAACVMLLLKKRGLDYWRILAIALLLYGFLLVSLVNSNIPYFFPELTLYFLFVSLNVSISNEISLYIRYKALMPILIFVYISMFILSLIILIMPNDLYTIFSKTSLFLMSSFIFLPYGLSLTFNVLYKIVRSIKYKKLVTIKN